VAGLFNLIPLVGPFIGAVPALFIAFTTESSGGLLSLDPGWPLAVGAGLALLIVQQIDNHVISPNVVARTVKMHPVTVMLGLLVGGTLLGLWGMLLAVPTIAAAKILVLHYWDTHARWPPPAARAGEREAAPGEVAAAPEGRPPGEREEAAPGEVGAAEEVDREALPRRL
jgi:predicted PurR-regulated permease PerM